MCWWPPLIYSYQVLHKKYWITTSSLYYRLFFSTQHQCLDDPHRNSCLMCTHVNDECCLFLYLTLSSSMWYHYFHSSLLVDYCHTLAEFVTVCPILCSSLTILALLEPLLFCWLSLYRRHALPVSISPNLHASVHS